MNDKYNHKTVLSKEVVNSLHINNQAKYIDATLGMGGHSIEIIKKGGFVLGIETDDKTLNIAKKRLNKACSVLNHEIQGSCFKLIGANFIDIEEVAKSNDFSKVDGILFDLGVNTSQLKSKKRGFSFSNPEAPLDMRMNPAGQKVTAADLLNSLRQDQLDKLFLTVLDYKAAKTLSRQVVERRVTVPFETVGDLLDLIKLPKKETKVHPATKTFLALRMAVNSELENLNDVLPLAFSLLVSGGKLVVISFHSSEDRIVKNIFKDLHKNNIAEISTKKPIVPKEDEILSNQSARSAKMRVLIKK